MDKPPPPLPPATTLCSLAPHALHAIIELLPLPDRRRLGSTCRSLRPLVAAAVRAVRLTQQDLEDWGEWALRAFSCATALQLHDVCLNRECAELLVEVAPLLLQQLRQLQLTDPVTLEPAALALLLQHCPQLRMLHTSGTLHSAGGDDADAALLPAAERRSLLVELALVRNTVLQAHHLHALLAAPAAAGEAAVDSTWASRLWGMAGDASISHHAPAWRQLSRLDLGGATHLGGSLAFMGLCPGLRALSLHSCYRCTNATLKALAQALDSSSAADAGADAEPPPLEQLNLSYTRVTDGGVPHLVATLPALRWLGLKGCNVSDDGLARLLPLRHLTGLHIKHCHRVTEEGVQGLASLSQLRSLSFGFTSMPEADQVAADIATQFRALTALDLLSSELTDRGLAKLAELQHLASLKLYQADITSEGLAQLADSPGGAGLTSLVLYGLGRLRSLESLVGFRSLQVLQLGSLYNLTHGVAASLSQLACAQLTALSLERMDGVSVQALQHVMCACHRLLTLRVRGSDVSAEDMAALAQGAAAVCGSSTRVWWAAAASVDTDDEEDGWGECR